MESFLGNYQAAFSGFGEFVQRASDGIKQHGAPISAARVFEVVLSGGDLPQGFRNRDLRDALYENLTDTAPRKKASGRVTRLLAVLHATNSLNRSLIRCGTG